MPVITAECTQPLKRTLDYFNETKDKKTTFSFKGPICVNRGCLFNSDKDLSKTKCKVLGNETYIKCKGGKSYYNKDKQETICDSKKGERCHYKCIENYKRKQGNKYNTNNNYTVCNDGYDDVSCVGERCDMRNNKVKYGEFKGEGCEDNPFVPHNTQCLLECKGNTYATSNDMRYTCNQGK